MKRGQPLRRKAPLRARTELRATSQLRRSPLLRGSGLNPQSPKRRSEQTQYKKLRVLFLAEHPRCEWPGGCVWPATQVHHKRGRVGALFLDVTHWHATCGPHHSWITAHPQAAYEMGVSERRIGAA